MRRGLYCLLAALFVLRQDFWWWESRDRLLGLPLGLAFQIAICLGAALVMGLLAYVTWSRVDGGSRPRP